MHSKKSVLALGVIVFLILIFWVGQAYFHIPKLFPFAPIHEKFSDLTFGTIAYDVEEHNTKAIRQELIEGKVPFIDANLSTMELTLYKDGEPLFVVPIKAKGKKGSWWETPTGLYTLKTKEENHFSSLGHVYMPFSMAFQGNFFIHGWPYYPDGTEVTKDYSGGCIRLSTQDAEKVFQSAILGEQVLVSDDTREVDTSSYVLSSSAVSADAYLVGDLKNNFIFSSRDKDKKRPIASITKLLSAVVAVEYSNIETSLTAPQNIESISTSIPRLKSGTSYTLYDLLFPLLQESSNQAGLVIGGRPSNKEFISRLNEKATSIGMEQTKIVDPNGVSNDNVATPVDLFRLAKYLYSNRQFILHMTKGTSDTKVYGQSKFTDLQNFNLFTDDPLFVGGKIGKTIIAGDTGLFIFELPFKDTTRPIAIILLNSKDLFSDVMALRTLATSFYSLDMSQ